MTRYPQPNGDFADQVVLGHIGNGKDRQRSYAAIAETLGGKWNRRLVELAVRRLRLDGWPIAADGRGCWLASLDEVQRNIDSLQHRLVSQYLTLRALRDTEKRMQRAAYPAEQLVMQLDLSA